MKLLKALAIVLVIAVMGSCAMAENWSVSDFDPGVPTWVDSVGGYVWRNLDGTFSDDFDYSLFGEDFSNLIIGIAFNMQSDKWMDEDWEAIYMAEGWTKEELCVAVSAAIVRMEDNAWVLEECMDSYEQYLADNHFGAEGYGVRQYETEGDLGDESIPLYVLCGLAVVALCGAVLARRKRLLV